MYLLGLDLPRFGHAGWNPLKESIQPGDTVVLKPNFVRDYRETQTGLDDCVVAHGAIIRAIMDYVYIALHGRGRIVVADAPQNDADFDAIRGITGLDEIQQFYRERTGFDVEVYDLRPEKARKIDGVIVGHDALPGDPAGYVKVDMARRSAFAEVESLCHLLYGSEYDTREVRSHHHGDVHEYLISKTVLDADCVISIPKLKTHKKTGLTACLKNMVGINGNKNWLPHHREGTPTEGGDEFPANGSTRRVERKTVAAFKRIFPLLGPIRPLLAGPAKRIGKWLFGDTNLGTVRSGNWYGNDTTWRMVHDLNRILMYADSQGMLHEAPARKVLNIVDGIVAGEGNGPLDPTPKPAGVVVAGMNAAAVDLTCARLMGFDYRRLPLVREAFGSHPLPLAAFGPEEVSCASNADEFCGPVLEFRGPGLAFRPHFGWDGRVEIREVVG